MPAAIPASTVMARAGALLNDPNQTQFTNAVQLPYMQIAWDELAEIFEENAHDMMKVSNQTFVITTAMTDIGGSTGPSLPNDLIEIQTLYERTNGSSEDWQEMTRKDYQPEFVVTTTSLIYWWWAKQIINFLGATTTRQVRVDYIGLTFAALTGPSSSIAVFNGINFLAFRTAGLCAEFVGENPTRATSLYASAEKALERLENINAKANQEIPARRRPFQATYRINRRF